MWHIGPKRIGLRFRETPPRTIEVGSDVSLGQPHFALSSKPRIKNKAAAYYEEISQNLHNAAAVLVRPSSARWVSSALPQRRRGFRYEASARPPVVSPIELERQARATERATATKPYNPGESECYFKSGDFSHCSRLR
jgi:hypothetical protein